VISSDAVAFLLGVLAGVAAMLLGIAVAEWRERVRQRRRLHEEVERFNRELHGRSQLLHEQLDLLRQKSAGWREELDERLLEEAELTKGDDGGQCLVDVFDGLNVERRREELRSAKAASPLFRAAIGDLCTCGNLARGLPCVLGCRAVAAPAGSAAAAEERGELGEDLLD